MIIGIKHFGISCNECKRQPILGTRWKCCECKDASLCTICYFTDKHNLGHQFERYNRQTTTRPEKVPKRKTSQKMKAFGIFPGAVVVRGKDWNYENIDGGPGSKGNVQGIKNYVGDTGTRNAVKIQWKNGKTGEYRIGACGKVDVKYVEHDVGTEYYREHLYIPDSSKRLTMEMSFYGAIPANMISDSSTEEAENPLLGSVLHVGDRVCIILPVDELKEVQRGRGSWSMRMPECIGKIGIIKSIQSDEIIEVEYNGIAWQLYKGAIRKVYDIKQGDTVKVLSDAILVERLQNGHGGLDSGMEKACGLVGKVEIIANNGDVAVQFGEQVWVYSPACLVPAPEKNMSELGKAQLSPASVVSKGNVQNELGDSLARLVAHLVIIGQHEKKIGPEQIVQAAARGDMASVRQFIGIKKELVNGKFNDLTPLMLAVHGGHDGIVELLMAEGADVNASSQDGTTAVLVAASGNKENVAMLLIGKGASVHLVDKNKRSLAHYASDLCMINLLRKVLEKGCDPNLQDVEGETALHDAIAKGHNRAVDLLLGHKSINLTLVNNMDFNPLIFAALKENQYATAKLLEKKPDLVKMTKKDGRSAFHVAAINDHRDVAVKLISKHVDVKLKDVRGFTSLHFACHEGYFEMVGLLIENAADVNAQAKEGHTPLHLTLGRQRRQLLGLLGVMLMSQPNDDSDRVKIACLLINNKADIQIKDKNGKIPLQVCQSQRVKTAVENFIRQKQQKARTAAAGDPFVQLLAALLIIPCIACKENVANAIFRPCGHKIVCAECSVKFDICPKCRNKIEARIDNEGRLLVSQDPCNLQ